MSRRHAPHSRTPLAAIIGVARGVLAVPSGYLGVLTVAAVVATVRRRGTSRPPSDTSLRFAVLVPAHDEEAVIAATLQALMALDYPPDRYAVHVLADHCSDRTAEIARSMGAYVKETDGQVRGKGPALAQAVRDLANLSTGESTVDVVVVVDADTLVTPTFLRAMSEAFASGAEAVQGHYRVLEPGASTGAALRAAALASRHHVRPLGRTSLGASSGLYGNGMAFTLSLLAGREWSNHLTEDIELQQELLLEGVFVEYAPVAVVEAAMPPTLEGATSQNERWERGRIDLARRYIPRLVREALARRGRRRLAAVDAVLDHVVPPMSVLVAAVGAVGVAGLTMSLVRRDGRGRSSVVLPAIVAGHVLSSLALDHAPRSVYVSLLHAPSMVVWKVKLWLRMLVRRDDQVWVRTARVESGTMGLC